MVKQIAVSNLPAGTTESEVKGLFTQYGRVTRVLFRGIGKSRTAYIDLSTNLEADDALRGLSGTKMGLTSLNVNEARPRES